jgi:hypothetical protein
MRESRHAFLFFPLFLLLTFGAALAWAQEEDLLRHPRDMKFSPLVLYPPQA